MTENPTESAASARFSAYDMAPIGICIVESETEAPVIRYTNGAFLYLVTAENDDPSEAIGKKMSEVWPDDELGLVAMALASGSEPFDIDLPIDRRDGGVFWIRLTITQSRQGETPVNIIWATDVTELKQAEQDMKRAAREAEAMNEMKSNFLATMSHEIRTPMQSVYGLLELIYEERDELDEDIVRMVRTARKSSSGLLEILDEILDLAKVDAGKMELESFEVPLRTLCFGVLEGMEVKVHGKDVRLVPEISDDVPFVIMGDPKRLRQILLNLVGNAMKFTETGSITLRITREPQRLKDTSMDDGYFGLRFEVVDTGMGMSKEVANKLFTPFTQADSSTTRKFGGTGLGLSICHRLVELMGGEIGVDSVEGEGSTFWFEIPTREAGTDTQEELPALDGIAVISVEDHPQGAREIESSLRSMGAEVVSCATWAEGLEMIEKRPFDVAVIDQGLPDGLGIDLIREAAKIRPFMGLIMYTVRDDIGLQHSARVLGATYLSKPASRFGLGEAVKAAAQQTMKLDPDAPRRLLIAEDTEAVRDVIRRQLDRLGVEADFVVNGIQALDVLAEGEHGILFTDLHMPEMDGYELVSRIRGMEDNDNGTHLPIIALTADVQLAQRQTYLSHGFDECLLKPVTLGQLRQLLMRWGILERDGAEETDAATEGEPRAETPPVETPGDGDLAPAIDRDAIVEQLGAFDSDTVEMLNMFVDMTQPLIDQLRAAFEAEDTEELRDVAHSLKGAAHSACCTRLGDLASDLQDAMDATDADIDAALVNGIFDEFERVRAEVAALAA